MNDLITVSIALCNNEGVVKRCLDSVLMQSYKNIEILVIDDGSTDNSCMVVQEICDDRVKCIRKKNGGLSSVRQYALDHARGEWITFIDADDYLSPTYVENLYKEIAKNEADMCVCSTIFMNAVPEYEIKELTGAYNIEKKQKLVVSDDMLANSYFRLLSQFFMCDSWNKMYRTDFLRENDVRFQTTKGLNGSDLAFNHKILLHNPVICTWNEAEYYHVIYKKSAVHRKNKKLINSVQEYVEQIVNEAAGLGKTNLLRRQISYVYMSGLRDAFQDIYREHTDNIIVLNKQFEELLHEHSVYCYRMKITAAINQPTKSLMLFSILVNIESALALRVYFRIRSQRIHKL